MNEVESMDAASPATGISQSPQPDEDRLQRILEERLALAVDAAELGTFYCPTPFGPIIWNNKCKEHFWLPPDAQVNFDRFYAIIHPDDREYTRQAVQRAIFEHQLYDVRYRTVAPDGQIRWVRAKGRAYYDSQGNPTRFDGVTLDVTEQRRIEEEALAAAQTNAKFRAFFEQGAYFAGVMTLDGTLVEANRLSLDACGYSRDQVVGKKFWECGWWNRSAELMEMVRQATTQAASGRTFRRETHYFTADGTVRHVDLMLSPVTDEAGKVIFIAPTGTDITDKRRMAEERELLLNAERSARAEAERASRIKDEFLATVSHELRTPLNAILGWSQILTNGPADAEDLQEGLKTIERNARAQAQIIDDLLDMSRIISGKVRLEIEEIDLAALVRGAVETVRPTAQAKGICLTSKISSIDEPILGDSSRLQQVFWNLLTNAVKFTPRFGQIEVNLARHDASIEVSVMDTGEGIKPEFLPHVFDRFRQADATITRRHGGLGLGLSIVKQLVELHGGSVRAQSDGQGKGATFVVSLPLAAASPASDPAGPAPGAKNGPRPVSHSKMTAALDGVRVLVVDDEPDARGLVKRLLEDCHAVVKAVGSVREAVEAVAAERFDVLVSDIGMPGEDGYSLIHRIRALKPEEGGDLPALALTAYARAEDRARSMLAGYQMHLSKPVNAGALVGTVARLSGRSG